MSGHSKWASIKHKKGKTDAARGKAFSKLIRLITVAARQGGGNPDNNPRLRDAILKAREINMPADNIDKAIKKGTGELEGVAIEEVTYEGYGPGGVAVMVDATTDNRNRTTAEVRHLFSKLGGNLGENGSVAWIFERKGLISFDNIQTSDTTIDIVTSPGDFDRIKDLIEENKIAYSNAEITMVPKTTVHLEGKQAQQTLNLIDSLEELDDVQEVFSNFEISDELLESLEQ